MKIKILMDVQQGESKIILLLILYIVLSELIKTGAEVYILEQSLELKLLLLSLAVVTMYKISEILIVYSIMPLLLLGIFGIQTGLMIYVLIFYSFLQLLKTTIRFSNE